MRLLNLTLPVLETLFKPKKGSERELCNAFGCFPTGVTVVSFLNHEGLPTGVTISSFSSLSLEPPLCMFSIGKHLPSCEYFVNGVDFSINVLACEQESIAQQFSTPMDNKFADIDWHPTPDGLPLINGSVAFFSCRHWACYDGGDHYIIIGEIMGYRSNKLKSLGYYRGRFNALEDN